MTISGNPSQKLTALLVDRLIEKGLLRGEKRVQLAEKIASGKMGEDDWKLEIELAIEKAARE